MESSWTSVSKAAKPKDPFRLLVDAVKEHALFLMSPSGILLSWNQGAERIQGYPGEAVLGTPFDAFFRDEDLKTKAPETLRETARREGFARAEAWMLRKDGKAFLADMEISPLWNDDGSLQAFAVVLRDVTAAREAEDRARQSQKMEAIGRLAGGIAHDFNNLLTAINGYSELGIRRTFGDTELQGNLLEIRAAGLRAASLTQQLLAFSRKQLFMLRDVDLNEVMGRMEAMLRRLLGEDILLLVQPGRDLPAIRADVSQVEQVILNLAVNARDAMPSGGEIVMTTSRVVLDESYVARHREATAGPHILFSLSDSGMGMESSILEKIFEPFFTTKEAGKGTGLGLATVYGIVKQSGGSIEVTSEPGKGSRFQVFFPVSRPEDFVPEPASKAEAAPGKAAEGDMILLVEDEEAVRNLVCKILSDHGYACLPAENGDQALSLLQSQGDSIRLLLTDVVLRGMNGRTLAERMFSAHPKLRVLYMSGHADNAIAHHGVAEGVSILHKPFTVQSLLARVDSILHG